MCRKFLWQVSSFELLSQIRSASTSGALDVAHPVHINPMQKPKCANSLTNQTSAEVLSMVTQHWITVLSSGTFPAFSEL